MIRDINEMQIGDYIRHKRGHFNYRIIVTGIDDKYIRTIQHCVDQIMPISFYLNKYDFSIEKF